MSHPLIIEALRSPRGRGNDKGALRQIKPVDLLAQQLTALAKRTGLNTAQVSDTLIGCVTQTADQGANIAKLSLLRAGWEDSVPGLSINRYCASGLSAVHLASQQAMDNDSLAVGGGVEMMSRVPMASDQGPLTHDFDFQQQTMLMPIGISADTIATQEGFSREQCDAYAVSSQQRAVAALEQGRFRSVVPVVDAQGVTLLERDETPRAQTTMESLAGLKPAFAAMAEKYGIDRLMCQRYGLDRTTCGQLARHGRWRLRGVAGQPWCGGQTGTQAQGAHLGHSHRECGSHAGVDRCGASHTKGFVKSRPAY
jgi:acetyl-CoA C-acetyltransferase